MRKTDQAMKFHNTRLLSAVYFGLLSVVGTILTDGFLSIMGVPRVIPEFQGILLGMLVASIMGALCGELIIHCKKPYLTKTFIIGFFMVIVSLPVFDLGILYFVSQSNPALYSLAQQQGLLYLYLYILGYSYLLFGLVLAVASGIAAMFLRGHMVYDVMHTDDYPSPTAKNTSKKVMP